MIRWAMTKYAKFAAAAVMYLAFAVYLYRHYFKGFGTPQLQDMFVVSTCLGSLGVYVLSRRWVAGFAESFFAGAIYGFGPFMLGLAKFHPAAGLLAAAIPWLFCRRSYHLFFLRYWCHLLFLRWWRYCLFLLGNCLGTRCQ